MYNGFLKGFCNVPDHENIRKNIMKADLKMIISDISSHMVQRWKGSMLPILRAVMDFCLQLEDCHFLFNDMF